MSIDEPLLNLIGRSLDLRLKNQGVIASNIANSDSPNYKTMKMDFEYKLQDAVGAESGVMELTDDQHQNLDEKLSTLGAEEVFEDPDATVKNNGNSVNRERELFNLAQEQQMYAATVNSLNRKLAMLKYAISEGGGNR